MKGNSTDRGIVKISGSIIIIHQNASNWSQLDALEDKNIGNSKQV